MKTLDLGCILRSLVFEKIVVLVLKLSEPVLVHTLHLVKVSSVCRIVLIKLSVCHLSVLLDVGVVAIVRIRDGGLMFQISFITPLFETDLAIFQVLGVSLLTLGVLSVRLIQT